MNNSSDFFYPILNPIADAVAPLFRIPGEVMRQWVVAIDVSWAKAIFIAYFALLLLWVLLLPKSEVIARQETTGKSVNLRPYAIAALVSQIVIYLIF